VEWVDFMFFADGEERIDHGGTLCSFMAAGEEVVFASQRQWPDGILDKVIVYLQVPVIQVSRQPIPSGVGVSHGLADLAFGQGGFYFFKDPFSQLVDHR